RVERLLYDGRGARGIDHISRLFHRPEFFRTDESARAVTQHNMDRDEIGVAEQIVLGEVVRAGSFRLVLGQVLAPGDGLHAEGLADRPGTLAEFAEAENAEGEAFEVAADGHLPGRAGLEPGVFEADPAGEVQHQAEGDAGVRTAGGPGTAYGHAPLGAGLDIE